MNHVDKKIKVLQVSAYDAPFFKEQVKELEKNGVECDILLASNMSLNSSPESVFDEIKSKLAGQHIPYYVYCSIKFYPRLLNKTLNNDYDIIHFNSGMVAPFIKLQPESPVVLTLWGDGLIGDRLYGQFNSICQYASSASDAVIVRSKEMQKELNANSEIIPSGVDTNKFRPMDKSYCREEIDWDENKKIVLFPYSPDRPKKRYEVARRVVKSVDSQVGNEKVELACVFDEPHEDIPTFMNAADALILPSTMEGSPNTVKEAMACNLPVISTNVGDVQERLYGVNGSFVCESEKEMEEKLKNILAFNITSNGREKVKEVSTEKMNEKIMEVYERVLNQK